MYCGNDNAACNVAGDLIRVLLSINKNDTAILGSDLVSYSSLGSQKVWQKRSFRFQTTADTNNIVEVNSPKIFNPNK